MSSEKPDQIQASVAAALSRLRGDLGPSTASAPKIDEPQAGDGAPGERARPANDVRGDPFFRSIQSPPAQTGMAGGSRGPIPMTPFARMQAPQEPASEIPQADEPASTAEPSSTIEIPEMPTRAAAPDLVPMPDTKPTEGSQQPAPPVQPQPQAGLAGNNSPLSRMMRGSAAAPETTSAGTPEPAQRDLLAGLPPPPISEPFSGDTESSAMRRRRRNRRMLAAAAVIIVVAVGAWLWTGSEQSTEVPVIAADTTPEKIKPADEGGLQVPNQNVQVLENMDGASAQSQGETVMPEPEQPVTPPAPSAEQSPSAGQAPAVVDNSAPDNNAPTTSEAPTADAPPAPEAPLSTAPLPEQDNNTAADATPPSPQAEPTTPAPTPEATQKAEMPAAPAPTTTEQKPAEPAPAPVASQPEPAKPTQPEQPAATQEAAVTPTAPAGNTRVQLAAGKSEESVKKEWAAMQKAHPDLLGSLSLTIERIDKGAAGIFYRLQAGPLADKAAAKKLCASLKQQNQPCLVVSK